TLAASGRFLGSGLWMVSRRERRGLCTTGTLVRADFSAEVRSARITLRASPSPSPDPFVLRVLVRRELTGSLLRPRHLFGVGVPRRTQTSSQLRGRTGQVREERRVVALLPVVRLPSRLAEIAAHADNVEVIQEGAVLEQVALLALLGVAGELAPARRQVADAGRVDPGPGSHQGPGAA